MENHTGWNFSLRLAQNSFSALWEKILAQKTPPVWSRAAHRAVGGSQGGRTRFFCISVVKQSAPKDISRRIPFFSAWVLLRRCLFLLLLILFQIQKPLAANFRKHPFFLYSLLFGFPLCILAWESFFSSSQHSLTFITLFIFASFSALYLYKGNKSCTRNYILFWLE